MPTHLHRPLIILLFCCCTAAAADVYKGEAGPHKIGSAAVCLPADETLGTLPLRVTWPVGEQPVALIIFSHGMGGSRDDYRPLAHHWASHGYVVIQPTHGDSAVLAQQRGEELNLQQMISFWAERPKDISRVLDQLPQIDERLPDFDGLAKLETVGVGGHSFGANTVQLLAGLKVLNDGKLTSHADPRPNAFLAISPQGLTRWMSPESFGSMTRPTLMVTGTNDNSTVHKGDAAWRMQAFSLLPPGDDKYLLFIQNAYHNFGGISGRAVAPDIGPLNDGHVRIVCSTSTAFWDAYLCGNAEARAWLDEGNVQQATAGQAAISLKKAEAKP